MDTINEYELFDLIDLKLKEIKANNPGADDRTKEINDDMIRTLTGLKRTIKDAIKSHKE